jgi:hypothetical protein
MPWIFTLHLTDERTLTVLNGFASVIPEKIFANAERLST